MNFFIDVKVQNEAGYEEALNGISFNKKQDKDMTDVALKLAKHDYGHNKFLESIDIWVEVIAPRYWWQEADTYRLTTKQSESTMHTLLTELESGEARNLFENGSITDNQYNAMVAATLIEDSTEKLCQIKRLLPEGFLQRRMWKIDYKTLRNIIIQRKNHRLPHWKKFIDTVLDQVEHPELLV